MENVKNTYIEEATDLLNSMESALLSLENNPNDSSDVEQIFRAMHTLKGNSAMFGLNSIADFVHDFETIYDKIRTEELLLTKELLNISLAALDHLRLIIHDSYLEDTATKENHFKLISIIKSFISSSTHPTTSSHKADSNEDSAEKLFHIYFEPNDSFLEDGSNPLYLITELVDMGKTKVIPHFKPINSIEEYNPTKCFSFWDIFLETKQTKKDVSDVFVFAESNSTIEINEFPYCDLLSNQEFNELIVKSKYIPERINSDTVNKFIELLKGEKSAVLTQNPIHTAGSDIQENTGAKKIKREKQISNIRVSSDKLDELMNLVSELVTTQASLSLYAETTKTAELETISENVEKLSRRLRDITFGMTLVPINNMFGKFQRMVRDVAHQLGKEIEFITEGGETELDKTIIETLSDPLMHILRNSLDHGIESPEERVKKGKPAQGRVLLKAYYSGVFVYIQIIDDGKGIDTDVIRSKAIQKGIIKNDDSLSEKEIYDLLFYPGFSTAQQVTDLSGRGVGMDVVKRNITDLKGEIIVHSKINEGTTLTIKLPLTLSIIDGLLVEVGGVKYIIPLSVVIKCYEINSKDMINNFNRLLILDGDAIPYINLREIFGYEQETNSISQLIVVSNGEQTVGVSVDFIVGEYQAVIKPLGKYYKQQDFVSGATILGDGTIALVVDTYKIVKLYTENIKMESHT